MNHLQNVKLWQKNLKFDFEVELWRKNCNSSEVNFLLIFDKMSRLTMGEIKLRKILKFE